MSQPIGVCIIVQNQEDQVLMGIRKNSYKSGTYGIPGGRVAVGEPLLKAASRELKEETGLSVRKLLYVGVVREFQQDHDFIHFIFHTKLTNPQPEDLEPHKCAGWEWHSPEKLPDNMLSAHALAIQLLHQARSYIDHTN